MAFLVAEFGDLTRIVTANLAAKYDDPISVGIGAVLGQWAVGGLAILGGQGLLKVAPMKLIIRVAALIMAVLAVVSLVAAIRGGTDQSGTEDSVHDAVTGLPMPGWSRLDTRCPARTRFRRFGQGPGGLR